MIRVSFWYRPWLSSYVLSYDLTKEGGDRSYERNCWKLDDVVTSVEASGWRTEVDIKENLVHYVTQSFFGEEVNLKLRYLDGQEVILIGDFPEPPKVFRSRFERIQ